MAHRNQCEPSSVWRVARSLGFPKDGRLPRKTAVISIASGATFNAIPIRDPPRVNYGSYLSRVIPPVQLPPTTVLAAVAVGPQQHSRAAFMERSPGFSPAVRRAGGSRARGVSGRLDTQFAATNRDDRAARSRPRDSSATTSGLLRPLGAVALLLPHEFASTSRAVARARHSTGQGIAVRAAARRAASRSPSCREPAVRSRHFAVASRAALLRSDRSLLSTCRAWPTTAFDLRCSRRLVTLPRPRSFRACAALVCRDAGAEL